MKNHSFYCMSALKNALLLWRLWRFGQEDSPWWEKVIASIGVEPYAWSTPKDYATGRPWFDNDKSSSTFAKFNKFEVSKGERISFWKDKWAGNFTLEQRSPDIFAISFKKDESIVECQNEKKKKKCWDLGLLRGLLLNRLIRLGWVGRGYQSFSARKCWGLCGVAPWLVREVYSRVSLPELSGDRAPLKTPSINAIWKFKVPTKVKVIL